MLNFENFNWKEIKNCPGRYTLPKGKNFSELNIIEFLKIFSQNETQIHELKATGLKDDKIKVAFFEDLGGIMTYEKD